MLIINDVRRRVKSGAGGPGSYDACVRIQFATGGALGVSMVVALTGLLILNWLYLEAVMRLTTL
jgi:hypothetical protein